MPEATIAIIGGGPAGLTTAGALRRAGLEAVVLDRDGQIRGSWTRRYDRLHLHTVRTFSGLAHYPIPAHYPRYMPKDMYAQYLQDYARRFKLDVMLNCPVHKVGVVNTGPYFPTFVVDMLR